MVASLSSIIAEDTRRRITRRYRVALSMVALAMLMVSVITYMLDGMQARYMAISNGIDEELALSQRIGLYTRELLDSASAADKRSVLQGLARAVERMDALHHQLRSLSVREAGEISHYHDNRIEEYLRHARALLLLPDAQIVMGQPDVTAVLAATHDDIAQNLEALSQYYNKKMDSHLMELSYSVFVLTGFVIGLLMLVATIVLRPAIAYVTQAQEKLHELNQLKGDFLANMSHEIRTPMNGIFGMTELLSDSELTQRQQHYVRTLQASAEHLLGLINDILDFSKIEAGQLKLDPQRFNLLTTIEEVLELLSSRAQEKGLELLLHYPPGTPCFIMADAGRIRQVMFNLVGNAIKFTEAGYVTVHVSVMGSDARGFRLGVAIEDTGIGIPEDKVASLFEKFMQVESSSTRARQGTGLGLAISRNLVRLMGGDITVESVPGKGTTFSWHIALPQADTPLLASEHSKALAGKRVLIVDDLGPNRTLFKEMLAGASIDCLAAENAQEALSIMHYEYDSGRQIHAVITDYKMPMVTGDELCRILKQDSRFAAIPVVILCSENTAEVIKRLDSCGASACLSKPVSQQSFLFTIAQAIGGHMGRSASDILNETKHADKAFAHAAAPPDILQDAHILLAEDNKVNKEIISEMLSGFGCRVTTADNGRIALDLIRSQPFDLVLMDCQMPEMDGFEAAQHIMTLKNERQVGPVPVIALTANALKGDKERCLQAGMDDYLSKPVVRATLRAMLVKWLEGSRLPTLPASSVALPAIDTEHNTKAVSTAGIDLSVFKATSDILGNKLSKVIGYYLEDAESYINHIAHALQASAPQEAVRPAHTLKSSSQQFGAITLAQMAARIEEQTVTSPSKDTIRELQELLVPMRREFAQVKDFYLSSVSQF